MFCHHLRLPVDVSLGVAPTQLHQNAVTWVSEHYRRLKSAYDLAHKKWGWQLAGKMDTMTKRHTPSCFCQEKEYGCEIGIEKVMES